jgi:acetyltransferase
MSSHSLTLPGGIHLGVRPIGGDDKPRIATFFGRLSDESRRRRFLGPKPKLSSRELAFLTEVDQRSHVAIAAHDDAGAIVGVARYAAWPDRPGVAEIAFEVVDEWHGRGIGTGLATQLVARAREDGLAALTASTLAENQPARALLVKLGFKPQGTSSGVVEYELGLRRE